MADLGALQFLVNGLVLGGILVMGSVGLSLVYGIRRFANFAHGEFMTLGAYAAYFVNVQSGLDIVWGGLVAFVSVAGIALAGEWGIFRRFEGRGVLPPLIASVGLSFVLQNVVRVIWGTRNVNYNLLAETALNLGGLRITPTRLAILLLAVAIAIGLHLMLKHTRLGKAMRATSDNLDLARTTGIDTRKVIAFVWVLGGGLAALGGVFLGVVTQVSPLLGFNVLLLLFSSVILGGIGSPYGAIVGGLAIGIAIESSKPVFFALDMNPQYSFAVAFAIMIVVLIVRPTGLFGGRESIRWPWRKPAEAAS